MTFYRVARIILLVIFKLIFKIDVIGVENIPKKGRAILCSNHVSLLDPIVLGIAVPRPISFMAKRELFEKPILGSIVRGLNSFPVDREGSDISAIRTSLKVLKEGKLLGIFPEGTRVKEMDLDNAKPGVALIGVKSKSPIIPAYIDSNYRLFSKVTIRIGEPIYLDEYFGNRLSTEDYKNISKNVMKSIYSLKSL